MLENLESPKPKTLGMVLVEGGYAPITSHKPRQVFDSRGFQQLLSQIDDGEIIKKWYDWALSDEDKRIGLDAGKEIMKLKDRYPMSRLKITAFRAELNRISE